MLPPKHSDMQISLGLVYRYIVYNEKTRLWLFYTHFAEINMAYRMILL